MCAGTAKPAGRCPSPALSVECFHLERNYKLRARDVSRAPRHIPPPPEGGCTGNAPSSDGRGLRHHRLWTGGALEKRVSAQVRAVSAFLSPQALSGAVPAVSTEHCQLSCRPSALRICRSTTQRLSLLATSFSCCFALNPTDRAGQQGHFSC